MLNRFVLSLMAIFTFQPEEATTTMHPNTPSFISDDIVTSITSHSVWSSTTDTVDEETNLFLQTHGAKAIAGVFAFASMLVTCIQVRCIYIADQNVKAYWSLWGELNWP